MKSIVKTGSVRVDLLGGTLDLNPINLIIPNVVTLNLATSLKAVVKINELQYEGVEINSVDYGLLEKFKASDFSEKNFANNFFGDLTFIALILKSVDVTSGISIELESGSPPGAGLGGSSAMGVTLLSALNDYASLELKRDEIIKIVNSLEGKMLCSGPAGYQDYYPALYGGVLALFPGVSGVETKQLYSESLKDFLEDNITLVFSGENRHSGINNWEVYKQFFDGKEHVKNGLAEIASLASEAYRSIVKKEYSNLIALIGKEGEEREKLFPGILTAKMKTLRSEITSAVGPIGMKVCGAGGGGCFLLTHDKIHTSIIHEKIKGQGMSVLDFYVEPQINK